MPKPVHLTEQLEKARKLIESAEDALSNVSLTLRHGHNRQDVSLSHCDRCDHATFDMREFYNAWSSNPDENEAAEQLQADCVFCLLFQYGAIAFEARNILLRGGLQQAVALMSVPAELYTTIPNTPDEARVLGKRLGEEWLQDYEDGDRRSKAFAELAQGVAKLHKELKEKYDLD